MSQVVRNAARTAGGAAGLRPRHLERQNRVWEFVAPSCMGDQPEEDPRHDETARARERVGLLTLRLQELTKLRGQGKHPALAVLRRMGIPTSGCGRPASRRTVSLLDPERSEYLFARSPHKEWGPDAHVPFEGMVRQRASSGLPSPSWTEMVRGQVNDEFPTTGHSLVQPVRSSERRILGERQVLKIA